MLLVSYDLNDHERPSAYDDVAKAIEENAKAHVRILYSQWLVDTDDNVQSWSDRLYGLIDANDRLFVAPVVTPYQGWLPQEAWDWLSDRVTDR